MHRALPERLADIDRELDAFGKSEEVLAAVCARAKAWVPSSLDDIDALLVVLAERSDRSDGASRIGAEQVEQVALAVPVVSGQAGAAGAVGTLPSAGESTHPEHREEEPPPRHDVQSAERLDISTDPFPDSTPPRTLAIADPGLSDRSAQVHAEETAGADLHDDGADVLGPNSLEEILLDHALPSGSAQGLRSPPPLRSSPSPITETPQSAEPLVGSDDSLRHLFDERLQHDPSTETGSVSSEEEATLFDSTSEPGASSLSALDELILPELAFELEAGAADPRDVDPSAAHPQDRTVVLSAADVSAIQRAAQRDVPVRPTERESARSIERPLEDDLDAQFDALVDEAIAEDEAARTAAGELGLTIEETDDVIEEVDRDIEEVEHVVVDPGGGPIAEGAAIDGEPVTDRPPSHQPPSPPPPLPPPPTPQGLLTRLFRRK